MIHPTRTRKQVSKQILSARLADRQHRQQKENLESRPLPAQLTTQVIATPLRRSFPLPQDVCSRIRRAISLYRAPEQIPDISQTKSRPRCQTVWNLGTGEGAGTISLKASGR